MISLLSARFKVEVPLFILLVLMGSVFNADTQIWAADTTSYPTLGNPTTAIATKDGRYVFVSVTNVGMPSFSGSDSVANARRDVISGLQIFRHVHGRLRPDKFLSLGTPSANGIALLPDGKTIVVGVGDAGVAFVNIQDAIRGKGVPYFAAQGKGAGTFDVAATPDGKYIFSSNEYGIFDHSRGNVGIIAVQAGPDGRVTHPETIGQIATGDVVPSLTLSADGSRLYVASELVPAHSDDSAPHIAGASNLILTKDDCIQRRGTPPRSNGFITVIDVGRAANPDLRGSSILSLVAAGCSPVRLVEATDKSTLFVSARGDNRILAFSPRLLESDPEHALQAALPSGGEAPVGIRLFEHDRGLAVANSNRFAVNTVGSAAFFNVHKSKKGTPIQTISTGIFPRNITLAPDGQSLYLTNYASRTFQQIDVHAIRTRKKAR